MKPFTILFSIFFCIVSKGLSQPVNSQPCYVALDSSKGVYDGECKKGKASGYGKYEWANGMYEGNWEKGLFHGYGTLVLRKSNDDSTVTQGFWKKGTYTGKYEKSSEVSILTNNISSFDIKKQNNDVADISITLKNNTGGASNIENPVLPKSIISNIQLLGGQFQQLITDTTSRIASRYILRQVTFPIIAILSFETPGKMVPVEQAKFEIFESGKWIINVSLEN